ncbi:MAG: LytTR family DNA-binding domain-containing protein [Crocinitomicaceae bacterium]
MSKLKMVIIEDEFFAADHLAGLVEKLGYAVKGVYHSGESFLKETDWDFDAAIVDIFLSEEMLGLDVAEHLQEHNRPFIFLTANKDKVTLKRAARLNPKAYISKPFNENDVVAALQIIDVQRTENIVVKSGSRTVEINPNDIVYVKSDGSYIEIQTTKKKYVQRKLLKEIEAELPSNFVRAHRSYVVNVDYIEQKRSDEIVVLGTAIPVSRGHRGF